MSRSESQEGLHRAVLRSESQEGLHQTGSESQEDISLAEDRYQDQPAPPRKRRTSKILLEAFGVSCQVEPTTAAEVAPMNPLADSQGPEAAVAEGAVAITIASTRPQGLGGPAQAYHYRQPLANTKTTTVVPPRGMAISTSLRMRRLRDGCSKLCFSPIGAVLVICCFSLLICVAEIFSPPPFGINTGANGAECNATGFEPMPICICVPPSATCSSSTTTAARQLPLLHRGGPALTLPRSLSTPQSPSYAGPRETVCVKDFKSLAFLALARCSSR